MRRVTICVPIAAVVLLASALILLWPPKPAGPGPAEVELLGLRCEVFPGYLRREVVATWPGAWRAYRFRYRVKETGAVIEVDVASFWSAAQAARAAGHLVRWTAAVPSEATENTWAWWNPTEPRSARVLVIRDRLLCDFFLTSAWGRLLTPADVLALAELAILPFGGLRQPLELDIRPPGLSSPAELPPEAGPAEPEEEQEAGREAAWLSLQPQGRTARLYRPGDPGGSQALLALYPGEEVRARLEAEAPREWWPRLALRLGRDLGRAPEALVEFGTGGEGVFVVPPDLKPGRHELVLAEQVFAVNSGVMTVNFEAADTSFPELDPTPNGLVSLLAAARRVLLAARDLPGVYRELDAALVQSLAQAAAALGGPVAAAWPPAFPDYALYVYGDEPSRARPAVICLTDPGHAVVIPGDVRLAGAGGLWELARAALEPPQAAADDPRRLLRATRVELRFAGEDRPVVLDLAGGPEAAARIGGLARAVCEGVINNLCEPEGELAAVLTFVVAGREEEVSVYPEQAVYSGNIHWRSGMLGLIRDLAGR